MGLYYWTMSPAYALNAYVFIITPYGSISNFGPPYVSDEYGVRPVINLRADITISSGDGTATNPYVVS